jgi:hypothetical protein
MRAQAGVADELAGGREAGDVADFGGDVSPSSSATPGSGHQQPGAFVGPRQRPQLALDRRQLAVEAVDHREQRGQRVAPDLGDAALGELLERPRLTQRGQVPSQAPLGQ